MPIPTQFAMVCGALIALAGEAAAYLCLKDLRRLTAWSALAQLGYALVGYGAGSAQGAAGATLVLLCQALARTLWWLSLRRLAGERGSFELKSLAAAERQPGPALLLGFAMFAALGLTPFTAPPGRELVLSAAVAEGFPLVALALAASGILAVAYTVRVVHAVCLRPEAHPDGGGAERASLFAGSGGLSLGLAGALALASLFAGPLAGLLAGEAAHHAAGWPLAMRIALPGAFALYFIVRRLPVLLAPAALGLAAALVAAVLVQPAADPLRQLFALLFACGGGLVVVYSLGYMAGHEGEDRYHLFLCLLNGSLVGLCQATDAASFCTWFELMTFSSYMLVVHKRTDEALRAGATYLVMCAGGAGVMQVGLLCLSAAGAADPLGGMGTGLAALGPGAAGVALMALAGFAVKAGLFPLHSWLPAAHPVAPSSISAPLSGLLTKVGVLGLAVVTAALSAQPLLGDSGQNVLFLLTAMSAATFVLGEVMALLQQDIKRMLAYSTLAQIGEIGLVLSLGTYAATAGALTHVLNHAVMKDLLFLAAGGLILRAGSQRIADLAGLGKAMPFTGTCMAVGLVSIMGLPPTGGFFGKYLMLSAALEAGQPVIAALILAGGVVGCVYYGRLIKVLFFTPRADSSAVAEAPLTMRAATGVLAALSLAAGLFPAQWTGLVLPAALALYPAGGSLPDLTVGWTPVAALPLLGAALAVLLRRSLKWSGTAAAAGLVLALGWALAGTVFPTKLQQAFALLALGLGILNMAYSTGYMTHSHSAWRFFAVFATMVCGLAGMSTAATLLAFFCFWEIMSSWPLFFAIIHEETPAALREGGKYFLFNMAGASLLFLGVLLLGRACGSGSFEAIAAALPGLPAGQWLPALCLMGAGMLMKAAVLPVRIDWQMHPPTAPTPVSGYISAMLLKSGPFGILLLRFVLAGGLAGGVAGTDAAQALDTAMYVGAWIGGITILYAGVQALLQTGIKEMLIYSTVSQIGYMVLGVCLGTPLGVTGGLLHLFNHMIFKDLAFLCAGALMFASHAHSLEELGGMGRRMPVTFLCFGAALFSAAGMPPFNGFSSKFILYHALIERGEMALAIIAILSSVITLAYFLKFLHGAFFGQLTPAAERAREVGPAMRAPIVLLGMLCLVTGVFPGLALTPVAGIVQSLGLTPPAVGLAGIASGPGACDMTLFSAMLLFAGGAVWLTLGRLSTRRVRRTAIHTCGETSVDERRTRIAAGDLYAAPLQLLAGMTRGYFSPKRLGGQHD